MDPTALLQALSSFTHDGATTIGEPERLALLGAASRLRDALENPLEKTLRIMFSPHEAAVTRMALDIGIIDIAVQKKGPICVDELARESKADPELIYRMLRMLANLKLFNEVEAGTFTALPIAAAFATGSPLREGAFHLSTCLPTVAHFPEYFASIGYKNPVDTANGPWQYAQKTTDHYWTWLEKQDPKYQFAFNTLMGMQNAARGQPWFEFFPAAEKLKVDSADRVALVDVGGNLGSDVVAFYQRYPDHTGKLVFEDLPRLIANVKDLPPAIEALGHDFFDPQPVKEAKAYYMRTVLHDWPDKQAKQILTNIRSVMAPDSLLLVNENVVAEKNAPWVEPHFDFHMLTFSAAGERTERQWRALLEDCGFEVVRLWAPDESQSLIGTQLIEAKPRY